MHYYKHIFFDLDHTLWDFEKNCSETLTELFQMHGLEKFPIDVTGFIEAYMVVNNRMWHEYNRGKLKKEDIRNSRFELTFLELGLRASDTPPTLNEEFLTICPTKGFLLPYAHEILSYLNDKYCLHIITNGFKETQGIKMTTSNLDKYFKEIVNSEVCGYLKPDRKVFEYAIKKVSCLPKDCIMIGDDLYTDVQGAKNAGLDQIYFNPKKVKHEEVVTHEIACLSELKNIL